MNSPFPMANVPPPPPLTPTVAGMQFPAFNVPPAAPAQPDWKAKAIAEIRAKVLIDSKPITTPQMEVWAYQEICTRLGNVPDVDKRIVEGLATTSVGGVNLGNDVSHEQSMTLEQRQAKVMELIPIRLKFKGAFCVGAAEYLMQIIGWIGGSMPQFSSVADATQKLMAIHNWLESLSSPYELDDATRAAANQQPPPNPISDQTTPQLAAPIVTAPTLPAEDKEEAASGPPLIDPTDGTPCKTLRGFKTRVTKTHKTEWPAFCQQHGLDPATGRKAGEAVPVAGAPVAPTTPPPASGPLPALVGQGAPITQPVTIVPTQPPLASEGNTLYQSNGQPTPAYAAAQAAARASEAMPVPPSVLPTTPAVFTPAFVPPGPSLVDNSALPQTPVATTPNLPPQPIQTPTFVPHPASVAAPMAQPTVMNRAEAARLLGGPVTLIICRLLEVNSVDLKGRMDANQLALLAEQNARAELRIIDLAQSQYGAGKQAAQRHFADLLGKNPHCYLLMNGFEPILPSGFLEILIARTVKAYQVTDQGRGGVEINF